MIVLLTILAATRAYPVSLQSPPVLSLDQLQSPSCSDPNNSRSLWDIIRSCALTLLLCTWVSVHPNIPSPDERWPRVTLRRVGLMLATLVVPEAIIAWALRQRLAAGELEKRYKGEGWTRTHGFFAIMGGFMKYEGNQPIQVLLPEELRSYSLTGNGDFPRLSKTEIQDKSKGDFISKAAVILQTSWFVTQCIARGVKGLPITSLELATLAFAGLNFVIYVLWLDKPLNVQCGVRVYKKRITDSPVDDGHVEATTGSWVALGDALLNLPSAIIRGPSTGADTLPWLTRIVAWLLFKPTNIIFGILDLNPSEKRVDTFYPRWHDQSQTHIFMWPSFFVIVGIAIIGIASAFGGIHCIGWSFTFPSNTERTLWRVASISITSIPIVLSLFFVLPLGDSFRGLVPKWIFRNFNRLQLFVYVLSRLVLLILAFLTLRLLPPAAYHTVRWTSFIPHL
ncbi:hypothetical protein BC827DRAFT_1138343 [Russula dissimulans]|nr:hypothetical protein BC827DRAFT_1138343 [Russula dissimulans]